MKLYCTEIPNFNDCIGRCRMTPKQRLTLWNWKTLLSKLIKFEEVYIYKKKKLYYLTSNY